MIITHIVNLASGGWDNFLFCDFKGDYTFCRLSVGMELRNIFNVRSYTISELYSVSESTQSLPIRGREVIATVKIKF